MTGERLSEEQIEEFKEVLEARSAGYAAKAARMRTKGLPASFDSLFPFVASLMAKAGRDALRVASGELTVQGYLKGIKTVSQSVDLDIIEQTQQMELEVTEGKISPN